MSKQDRNTFLTILIVLVVCTVSLVILGSYLWQIISPGVASVGQVLGARAGSLNTDFNFEVEGFDVAEEQIESEQEQIDQDELANTISGYDYNFTLPKRN